MKKYQSIAMLDEAYQLAHGIKKIILKQTFFAVVITLIILIPLLIIAKYAQQHYGLSDSLYHTFYFAAKVIAIVIAIKIWVPVIIIGVRRSIGLSINLDEIKLECFIEKQGVLKLSFIYAILLSVLSSPLLLFPGYSASELVFKFGVYVLLSFIVTPITFFAFPLVIIKKLAVFEALNSAYKNVYTNWRMIAGPIIFINILFPSMLGCLTLLRPHMSAVFGGVLQIIISLLSVWLIPIIPTLGGILFRETYGLRPKKISTD